MKTESQYDWPVHVFLSCSGYTEMDGRYCLMLKNTYKKGVGIVHGSSNTGRFVAPLFLVRPSLLDDHLISAECIHACAYVFKYLQLSVDVEVDMYYLFNDSCCHLLLFRTITFILILNFILIFVFFSEEPCTWSRWKLWNQQTKWKVYKVRTEQIIWTSRLNTPCTTLLNGTTNDQILPIIV